MPNTELDFLPYSTPEREGVSTTVLLDLFREWRKLDSLNSFILVRRGKVIAEHYYAPYRPDVPHMLFSLTKSFTSLAVGFAEAEGRLTLDAPAADFFPDKTFAQDRDRIRRVTVRHLLTMSGGHDKCPLLSLPYEQLVRNTDYVKTFFDAPFVYAPGEKFVYNSAGTHVLAAIVKQVTGMNMTAYLTPRLLAPLGISTFSVQQAPDGVEMGGWGGSARTRDLAKLGQCILQGGVWQDRQLIPADYLRRATSVQQDNSANEAADWKLGYGFQFWKSTYGFRGDGACGQYMLVIPEADMVVAITSGLTEMCRILTPIWEKLMPTLYDHARADKPEKTAELDDFLTHELVMPLAAGGRTERISSRKFTLKPNPCGIRAVTVSTDLGAARLVFAGPNGQELLRAGFGYFIENPLRLTAPVTHRTAASAAWTGENTLRVALVGIDSPYRIAYDLDLADGGLKLKRTSNLQFLNPDWPVLESEK